MFLSQRQFRRIVENYSDRTHKWSFTHCNHLLVLMFSQLLGRKSLRELPDITTAYINKSFFLGFGR